MDLIKQHILPHLNSFTNEIRNSLDNIISEIQNDSKIEFTEIIYYLEHIINLCFLTTNSGLSSLHIHIENDFNDSQKLLLAEFILIKFQYNVFMNLSENEENLDAEIQILINKVTNFSYPVRRSRDYPLGVSTVEYNQISHTHKKNKELVKFYKRFNKKVNPKLLFNSTVNYINALVNQFEFTPFARELNNNVYSSNLLNASQTLNSIDSKYNDIIDSLDSIVLFDCDRKRIMTNFSFEEISKWNSDYGTRFSKYLIITFGKENSSINHTRNKLELIRERFKIPIITSYTITSSELNFLLNSKESTPLNIEFVGFESSIFWDEFILETKIIGLYELRSIKLMNIYSICYNDEIKNFILNDLFSNEDKSELLSSNSNTKQAILQLRDEDVEKLKQVLSQTLEAVIKSNIKSKIIEKIANTNSIVLDEAILRNVNLMSKIRVCLGLTKSTKFKTWSDLINSDLKDILILSYRDQGRYPNYYFPNLLELELNSECIASAILPSFLFIDYYNWSKYNLYKEYHKLLSHPIRENFFEWNKLKNKIQELKPEQKLNIDWNLEIEYSNSEQRESYKVKVKGQRLKTAYSSDLFVITDDTKTLHKVVKIDYLFTLDNEDGKVFIQNLDEIQQNINIYDKIVNKKQQEAELEVIRKQFNLRDETAGRLWKVLLKNLAEDQGEDQLYSDLKKYFETKGIKIVSQFHFKNSWINPQSESIAPLSKRVFIELCEYLKIPKIYFIIIQRIRNSSKQSSRQSTRQMNQLLKDLFNDGCFDSNKNARDIITNRLVYYKANHPLDDLGIDENYLADNLVTLVELILPELKLLELENIEKNNYE